MYFTGTSALNRHICISNKATEVPLIKAPAPAKEAVRDATAEFVAVDLRAISTVEGPGFRSLAQKLILIGEQYGKVSVDDVMSDPMTIRARVHELAEAERAELYPRVRAAAEAEELSCTLDMWTEDSRKFSLMTCNVFFPSFNVKTEEWEVEAKVFFTEQFPKGKAKTAENLRAFIMKNFVDRGIPEEKVKKICFVTDGEQALKNALDECWREYCTAHAYNIVFQHSITVTPKDFQSLPPSATEIIEKVDGIMDALKKVKAGKLGKKIITDAKLTFPKQYSRVNCTSLIVDNFLKVSLKSVFYIT